MALRKTVWLSWYCKQMLG